jgi:hypothetical protein
MKLTEAKLKQLIKEVMAEGEGAKGPADLPDGVYVSVEKHPSEKSYSIRYVNEEGKSPGKSHGLKGTIVIEEPQLVDEYPCNGAFMIGWSAASSGFGPLLYDVAMEIATMFGGGLVSDRTIVSTDAQAVWSYYLNRRTGRISGDVTATQLDDEDNSLTYPPDDPKGREPINKDNCVQNIARATITGLYDDFTDSPLSKAYKKQPTTLKALGNKLRVVGFELNFGNEEGEETEQKDLTN